MAPRTLRRRLYSGAALRSSASPGWELKWLTVVILCLAGETFAEENRPDSRAQEARTVYAKAEALYEAGQYAPRWSKVSMRSRSRKRRWEAAIHWLPTACICWAVFTGFKGRWIKQSLSLSARSRSEKMP